MDQRNRVNTSMRRGSFLALSVILLLAAFGPVGTAWAAEVPPYGRADFVPTPQTPIGYRANGNGWYPGATPPTEWWEGTPVQKEMGVAGTNSRFDPSAPRGKKTKVWSLGDNKSKNILWKSPLPGWGDAQPIVVGNRVIVCCDPDVVICFDADTGKVLWQDRLQAMTLPALAADRRKLDPAPRGQGWQYAWEIARASYLLKVQAQGGRIEKGDDLEERWPAMRPLVERCRQRVAQWDTQAPTDLPPAARQGLQQLGAAYQALLDARDADGREAAWQGLRKDPYVGAFKRGSGLASPNICWQGHVGGSFSTPVSDGKLVVVCFAYGQVGAYDVATGKRAWAFRDPLVPSTQHVNHGSSPWMFRELVMVRSGDGQAMMGLDKATGAVRWETQIQMHTRGSGANHGNYITPVLTDVPVKEGGTRPVLVTKEPPVLDPLTGEVLGRLTIGQGRKASSEVASDVIGQLPSAAGKPRSDRGSIVGADGLVFSCWGYDAPSSPGYRHRLSFAEGKLRIEALGELDGSPGSGSTALLLRPGALVGDAAMWFNPVSGARLAQLDRLGEGAPGVLCGDLLIVRLRQNPFNRVREDFAVTAEFAVIDLKDPAKPRVITRNNLLGGDDLPADVIFDTYLKGFDKKVNIGCYRGICAWFGCRVGGVVPKGSRLYIQSSVGMYCIGEK
jgi:outer membrane protein assembly factor BamB